MISEQEMLRRLRVAVQKSGSQRAFATEHGVSPQYVCDCLKGRRNIGVSVAQALGYRPVVAYVLMEERQR